MSLYVALDLSTLLYVALCHSVATSLYITVFLHLFMSLYLALRHSTPLYASPPGLFHLLLGEQRPQVHGVSQLHVGQFAGHGDGGVPAGRSREEPVL